MSRAPNWFPGLSGFFCVTETHFLSLLRERLPPLRSTHLVLHGRGSFMWPGMLSWWQRGENTVLWLPDEPQEMWVGSDSEMRHQSFWEASLLSRLAATLQICIQRLSPKNKGGFPDVPCTALQKWGVQLVPYMVTYYFIGYFNLWGKVTSLVSPTGYLTVFKYVFLLLLFHCCTHYLSLSPSQSLNVCLSATIPVLSEPILRDKISYPKIVP
jgi:hypothetical protein